MWDVTYRPIVFGDVLGQEGSVKALKARLANGLGLETSYIFCGAHGGGKTTLARILARALLCPNVVDGEPCNTCDNCKSIFDGSSAAYLEQDAASKGSVENIRGIVDTLPFHIVGAAKRICVFDEAHRMSRDAQDVLLKPIEEKEMVAIFCTTEPEKIRGPIRSRCEEYAIRKVPREVLVQHVKNILDTQKVESEEDALLTVIDYHAGHIRDTLKKLEQIAQMGPITLATTREYLNLSVVSTYYEILLALGSPTQSIPLVEQVIDRVGVDDVATGLAEAAMNSYRVAHKLYTDFSLTDRALAEQVHKMYGESLAPLASFFISRYKSTKVGLLCDIVRCAAGVPASNQAGVPPIAIQVTGLAPVAAQPLAPAAPPPSAGASPTPPATPPLPVKPSVPAPNPAPPSTAVGGFADLGYSDLDKRGMRPLPRGNAIPPKATIIAKVGNGRGPEIITWREWRQGFLSTLNTMFGRTGG